MSLSKRTETNPRPRANGKYQTNPILPTNPKEPKQMSLSKQTENEPSFAPPRPVVRPAQFPAGPFDFSFPIGAGKERNSIFQLSNSLILASCTGRWQALPRNRRQVQRPLAKSPVHGFCPARDKSDYELHLPDRL